MKRPYLPRRSLLRNPTRLGSSGRSSSIAADEADAIRALLSNVKDKLLGADAFVEVMDAFFEQLGTDLGFLERGVRVPEQPFQGALVHLAERMAGEPLRLMEMKLLRLGEHRLTHGMLFFVGWLGIVLLFEDVGMGVLALSQADLRGPTLYGRFKIVMTELPAPAPQ